MEELRLFLLKINQEYHIGVNVSIHEYLKTVDVTLCDNFDTKSVERHNLGSLTNPKVFDRLMPLIEEFTRKVKEKHNYH